MTLEERWKTRYEYAIVQTGSLPLNPEAGYDPTIEHRCTSALIWPEGESPSHHNAVLTDPCFTSQGYRHALLRLEALDTTFQEVGWLFVTHPHRDHRSNLMNFLGRQPGKPLRIDGQKSLEGFATLLLPGHTPTQKGLLFRAASQRIVCVCGDAILAEDWLRAWKYYWPNFYQEAEILETWKSVATILARSDKIIPGHGVPFEVTAELLEHLVLTFAQAEHADQCPDVLEILKKRHEGLI